MEWLQFEHEIRELVQAFGYEAETTTPSHDFGVDVKAHNQNRSIIIQCKLYGKGRIGGDTMMKLVGSRQYFKATDAICITTSKFTRQAKEIASSEDIKLVDCEKLIRLCQERNLIIPSLTFLATNEKDVYPLQSDETRLGRDRKNHIVLFSKLASRSHAIVKREGLYLHLYDCESTNGTKLNGKAVIGHSKLNYFDKIRCGEDVLSIALQTPSGTVITE